MENHSAPAKERGTVLRDIGADIGLPVLLLASIMAARPAAAETPGQEPASGPGFHAGAALAVHQPIVSDLPVVVPKLELGLFLGGLVDLYLALGLDIRRESFADDNRESSSTAGALMTELGARFVIGQPRPKSASLYLGVAAAPVFGIASHDSEDDDDEDDYHARRAREYLDRFDLGVLMGIRYLASANFGLDIETGFVTTFNNLKGIHREEPDKHLLLGFYIPFALRATYYF